MNLTALALVLAGPLGAAGFEWRLTVHFDRPTQGPAYGRPGLVESCFGRFSTELTRDAVARRRFSELGHKQAKIYLGLKNPADLKSPAVCRAQGCDQNIPAEDWLKAIQETGAEAQVVLEIDPARSDAQDAAIAGELARRWSKLMFPVRHWTVGNEPNHDRRFTPASYASRFNAVAAALKAVDPGAKVGGPGLSWPDTRWLHAFLARSKPDFLDVHRYGQGGDQVLDDPLLLGHALDYARDAARLLSLTPTARFGEMNLDWDGDPRCYQPIALSWMALALGSALEKGADAFVYSSKNMDLGLLVESLNPSGRETHPPANARVNDPMPAYWAFKAFSGGKSGPLKGRPVALEGLENGQGLWFFAAENRALVAVNYTTHSYQAVLELRGLSSLAARGFQAHGAFPHKEELLDLRLSPSRELPLRFPPHSVTRLDFQ